MTSPTTAHAFKVGDRVHVYRDMVFQYTGTVVLTRFDRGDVYRIREDKHGTVCDSYGFELALVYCPDCTRLKERGIANQCGTYGDTCSRMTR